MRRVLLWVPACAHMALIYYASSVPGDDISIPVWDKLIHFGVYAVLGVAFMIPTTDGRWSRIGVRSAALAVALSLLYGVLDEIHQSFTPDRTPDVMDLFANAVGATIGVSTIVMCRALVDRLVRPNRRES